MQRCKGGSKLFLFLMWCNLDRRWVGLGGGGSGSCFKEYRGPERHHVPSAEFSRSPNKFIGSLLVSEEDTPPPSYSHNSQMLRVPVSIWPVARVGSPDPWATRSTGPTVQKQSPRLSASNRRRAPPATRPEAKACVSSTLGVFPHSGPALSLRLSLDGA